MALRPSDIDLAKLTGSTFTVTNYGVVGASYGTPIINYPEVAILGIGKYEDKPVVKSGKIVMRRIIAGGHAWAPLLTIIIN